MPNTDPKPLTDIQVDAVFLHGLCQGVGILYDETQTVCSPASNATHSLICEVIAKAEQLANDIDAAESHTRKMERALRRAEFRLQDYEQPNIQRAQEETS